MEFRYLSYPIFFILPCEINIMSKTIADAIRHVKIYPEDLGMATLIEKVRMEEDIVVVIKHASD